MNRSLSLIAALVFLVVFSRTAVADIIEVASLDLTVMRCDVVVRGRVVTVVSTAEGKRLMTDTITVEIEELIKGPDALKPDNDSDKEKPLPRVTFVVHSDVSSTVISNALPWRNMAQDMLFCLDKHDEQDYTRQTKGKADYVLRPESGKWAIALDERTAPWGIYGGGKLLKNGEEILTAARLAAKRPAVEKEFGILPDSKEGEIDRPYLIQYPDRPDLRKATENQKNFGEPATRPAP